MRTLSSSGRALSLAPFLPLAQAHTSSGTSGTPHPGATSFGGDATTPTGCPVVSADPWFSGSRPTQRRRKWAAGDCSLEVLDSLEEENKRLKRAIQYQAGTVAAAHAREKRLQHRNRLLEERVKTAVSAREALRRRCARMLSTDHIVMGGRRMRLVAMHCMQQDAGTPAGKETFSTVPINEEGNDVMDEEASADIRFRKRKVRCFNNLVTVEKGDPPALSLSAATPAAAPSPPPTPAIRAQVRNSLPLLPARPGPPLPVLPRPPAPPRPQAPLSPPLTSRPPPIPLSLSSPPPSPLSAAGALQPRST